MASFDKAAFEMKAFKFVPYLILGKIIFATWFISYLVTLELFPSCQLMDHRLAAVWLMP